MTKVEVDSGICGFKVNIEANSLEPMLLRIKLDSECPNIKNINIDNVDISKEFSKKLHNTRIYEKISKVIPHISCPVYSGIFKALEVEAGMALPKDVNIIFK
jgi:hypothetical protein